MAHTVNIALCVGLAVLLCGTAQVRGGCSDEEFLKAEQIYQAALKEESGSRRIELLEQAFAICPSHGGFAKGYFVLGKLYFDMNNKVNALRWLGEAQRFSATMLETAKGDLAQTNLLLANLYKEEGNDDKAVRHFNIYRALAKQRNIKLEKALLQDADRFLSLVYTPTTLAETLAAEKSVTGGYRSNSNRIEIYFDFAKAALDEEARLRLDAIGKALQSASFADCTLVVEGHTDEVGGVEFNCDLGKRRARAVEQYLAAHWGPGLKICPVSYGKSDPLIPRIGHDRSDWHTIDRLNRRAVIWNSGIQKRILKDLVVEYESRSPCDKLP